MKINLENILVEFQSFCELLKDITGTKLISFAFPIEKSEKSVHLNNLSESFDDIFLFRTANNKLLSIGLNSALELNAENSKHFSDVTDIFEYWKQSLLNNWTEGLDPQPSIIFCSAKFDPNYSSPLWDEFTPFRIYVPEFILTLQNENLVAYFNFIFDKSGKIENYFHKLSDYLNKLSAQNIYSEDLSNVKNWTEHKIFKPDNSVGWTDSFLKTLEHIQNGDVKKLVLSRVYKFPLKNQVHWDSILQKLHKRFPDCYQFFLKHNGSFFFGSSPEMFLKVSNKIAEVESVAGSAARGKKTESDYELEKFLKSSEKNHQEHLYVSNFITDALIKYSDNVRVIEEKQIRKLDNIQHLITKISAELNSKENLFELIDTLFPTPAVCGVPKETALNLIRKLEAHDRGLYSGLVGIFNFESNCELAVAIRSALVKENQVIAFAGAGIVKKSNLQEEFLETNLKLNTILYLFTDENKS